MGEEQERKKKLPNRESSRLKTEKKAGRPKELDLKQRTSLFLFARRVNKSNRDIENLLLLLNPLSGFEVSYKYVERLYSDEEVSIALHNLFILLLEGCSGKLSGDGTGYSVSITKHYRTGPKKELCLYL